MSPVDESHPTENLDDETLFGELEQVYAKRLDTLRHGGDGAWQASDRRMAELEGEYLRRHPEREVSAARERPHREGETSDSDQPGSQPVNQPENQAGEQLDQRPLADLEAESVHDQG